MTDYPLLLRLEYAPYHVSYILDEDGEIQVEGTHSEMLDAPWEETDSFWCRECDAEIAGEEAAIEHLREVHDAA